MRRNLFLRIAGWLAFYWVSVAISLIVLAWVVVLLFALWPEASFEWQQFINKNTL